MSGRRPGHPEVTREVIRGARRDDCPHDRLVAGECDNCGYVYGEEHEQRTTKPVVRPLLEAAEHLIEVADDADPFVADVAKSKALREAALALVAACNAERACSDYPTTGQVEPHSYAKGRYDALDEATKLAEAERSRILKIVDPTGSLVPSAHNFHDALMVAQSLVFKLRDLREALVPRSETPSPGVGMNTKERG